MRADNTQNPTAHPPTVRASAAASVYNATVVQRTVVAPGLMILRIAPDTRPFPFKAGQYVVLGLKVSEPRVTEADEERPPGVAADGGEVKLIRRAYSIASSSRAEEYLEFYLTLVASGELTPRLFRLQADDRVHLGPKAAGVFTLDRTPPDRHVLLVATGTGLAPYMSMLRSELACGDPRRFVVLHGARYSWDLGYRAELASLARRCANLIYLPAISRPQEDSSWGGLTGYLQELLVSGAVEEATGLPVTPEHFHVYLCGNSGMIEASIASLDGRGFVRDTARARGTIHSEEYW